MTSTENSTGWQIHPVLLNQILLEYRYVDREIGGVLGLRDGLVIRSIRDTLGYADTEIYRPDPDGTAAAIRKLIQGESCDQICFIHSHPSQYPSLSHADIRYVQLFLQLNPIFENVGMAIVVGNTLKMFCLYRCQNRTNLRSMGSFSFHSEKI